MWSYYGAKTNVVDLYPRPMHDSIIEPFAGTARYSLKYFDRDILLVDKYDVIINIWKWLQQCSPNDITSLPRLTKGDNINNFKFDCQEARDFMGFCIGFGFYSPRQTATVRLRNRPNALNYTLNRVANNLYKIRHWKFVCTSYEQLNNTTATWFIDPPYQIGGKYYKCSSKKIDFNHLSEWCKTREGQVIACEDSRAKWLDFKPLVTQQCLSGQFTEAIWTNHDFIINPQQKLFV